MVNKILSLLAALIILTGCSEFALLSSGTSLAVSNNVYAKSWSGLDVGTYLVTKKDIKTHVYEKVITIQTKVNETFILKKPEMLSEEKKVLVAVPIIEVKESEIFKPDNNLLLASISTPLIVDKIWTTKEWDIYSILLIGLVLSNLIFISSLIYLGIYFLTATKIEIKIKKRKIKKKRKKSRRRR
tara:strand:+ start:647 stop:1201 length:555 start_codon:yes stop_codon:yes gene_type:complete